MLAHAAALTAALLMCVAPAAHAAAVQVAVEVPQGKTRTVRLRKLPKDAVVAVKVRTDRALSIALVSAAQLKRANPEALFRAVVNRGIAFRVVIPEAGDYFLVLDNRRGTAPAKTRATIEARRGTVPAPRKPPAARPPGEHEKT